MAEVVLFHHIQGLTDGVRALADDLAVGGHVVHTPDLFAGREFRTIREGMAYAQEEGFETLTARALEAAADLPSDGVVFAGISFGVGPAQRLAQTTPGVGGALLLESCFPAEEFGGWPAGLPAQVHGMVDDEFFAEDLPAARALSSSGEVELYEYDGSAHLFTDPSLDSYAPRPYAQMLGRALAFLASV